MVYVSPLRSVVGQIVSNKEIMTHFGLPGVPLNGKTPYIEDSERVESRYVKLEDIHKNGKEVMLNIISWMNIDWHDCLTKSTVMGLLWHNRRESIKQSGLSEKGVISQKHDAYLSNFDKKRLGILLRPENSHFGYGVDENKYPVFITAIYMFLPFRMEFSKIRIRLQFRFIRTISKENLKKLPLNQLGPSNFIFTKLFLLLLRLPVFMYEYALWQSYKIYEYFYIRYLMLRKLLNVDKANYIKMLEVCQ